VAISVAVVGLGLRGRQWVQALRRIPGCEVAACVEVDDGLLREAPAALGVPVRRCYARLEDALDDARPQAVIVATTIGRHAGPSRTVIARQIPLLVEKPFALTLREARSLVAAAAEAKVPLMIGQTYRYTGMAQTLRRLLRGGTLGVPGAVVYQVCRGNAHLPPAVTALPHSVLWETMVHHVDLFRYLLDQEVAAVAAESFAMPWSRLGPGAACSAMLTFTGGTRAVLTATYDSRPASWLRIVTERGVLVTWRRWVMLIGRGRVPRIAGTAPTRRVPEAALMRQFERAIRTGEEPECSGRDNLNTIAVLEACARSATERRTIDPRTLFDEPL
jgi:predicted dehydrogenase